MTEDHLGPVMGYLTLFSTWLCYWQTHSFGSISTVKTVLSWIIKGELDWSTQVGSWLHNQLTASWQDKMWHYYNMKEVECPLSQMDTLRKSIFMFQDGAPFIPTSWLLGTYTQKVSRPLEHVHYYPSPTRLVECICGWNFLWPRQLTSGWVPAHMNDM